MEHFDVLIIGAGLSGIGAACHLQKRCPGKTYAILEGRARLGGTWDLFRYPGVRSDSDMYTLGYAFKPWSEPKAIADGPSILAYLTQTAREHGVDQHIRYGQRVVRAAWHTPSARWTLSMEQGDGLPSLQMTCNFLLLCAGYYRYDQGYAPEFEGRANFAGPIVHPQHWPEDVDYAGKRVVVIGSGATAVTLVPAVAQVAAHVTLLQRSPSYMLQRPSQDPLDRNLKRVLPRSVAHGITRWKQILLGWYVYRYCKRNPDRAKKVMLHLVGQALGDSIDVQKHFTPRYNPWEQRLCLVPDGDLFEAIKSGRASVVTDEIDHFTATGIALKSGGQVEADVIVTATGLNLQVMGGLAIEVDGQAVDMATTMNYKGMMYSGIPNLISVFGYVNSSWTLRSDLISEYLCRLLDHMARHGYTHCVANNTDAKVSAQDWVDFSSSYFGRSVHLFPKQGNLAPWKLNQSYPQDIVQLRWGRVDDGVLRFYQEETPFAPVFAQ